MKACTFKCSTHGQNIATLNDANQQYCWRGEFEREGVGWMREHAQCVCLALMSKLIMSLLVEMATLEALS